MNITVIFWLGLVPDSQWDGCSAVFCNPDYLVPLPPGRGSYHVCSGKGFPSNDGLEAGRHTPVPSAAETLAG